MTLIELLLKKFANEIASCVAKIPIFVERELSI